MTNVILNEDETTPVADGDDENKEETTDGDAAVTTPAADGDDENKEESA